jgi:hypothetical protein
VSAATDRFRYRLGESLREWTGLTVAPADEVSEMREQLEYMGPFLDEVEDMAATVLDYVGGRPHEVQARHRRRLAQQSRIALMHDPLAGAEATLRANFAFGKGISKPQAKDPDVQKIIDRAWEDPNNERKLTSYEAQRHRSNEMLTSANLFATIFTANGKIRVGFRDADDVTDVVTDPEDDETPLYYVVRKRKIEWDYTLHAYKPVLGYEMEGGTEKVWYLEHWRNVEDLTEWLQEGGKQFTESRVQKPPPQNMLPGKVEHFRINRIGRSQFGVPPWARTLRYYTALNQLTESQVQMRQGAASIIAQRIRRTGPRDLMRNVSSVMSRAGEIGSANFRRAAEGGPPSAVGPGTQPGPREATPPPAAGSWYQGFEHDRIEAVNLRSGAGEALADAQIVRAPIAAVSGFGQHYLGDPSSSNLATSTTLELVSLMEIAAWQETFEGIYRWFTDRGIEAAVQAGQLGGMVSESATIDTRSLRELNIQEDKAEMEARTGKDLTYTFQMPYPGRRNLPDVVSSVTATLLAFDPSGQNFPLREKMLDYLLRHGYETEDPGSEVEEVIAAARAIIKEGMKREAEQQKQQMELAAYSGVGPGGVPQQQPPNVEGGSETEGASQYGEARNRTPPSREMGGGPAVNELLAEGIGTDPTAFLDKMSAAIRSDAEVVWGQAIGDPGTLTRGAFSPRSIDAPASPGSSGPS